MVDTSRKAKTRRHFLGLGAGLMLAWLAYATFFSNGVSSALAQASRRGADGPQIGRNGNRIVYGHSDVMIPDGWTVETDFIRGVHVGYTLFPAEFEHFYDSPVIMTITPGLRDAPDRLEPFINMVLDDRELQDSLDAYDYAAWKAGDDSILSEKNVTMNRERGGTIGNDPERAALINSNINVIYNKRHVYIAQVGGGVGALIDFYVAKPEEMQPYFPLFQSIIESFRFNPAAVSEVGSQDRLIGLYSGSGGYWLLYDNGRFASTPDNGYKLPSACNPEVCGRFVPGGGDISFIFDDGKTKVARVSGNGLAIGSSRYARAQPLSAGTPLSGLYTLESRAAFSGAFGSGSVYTDNKFAFDTSGNFQSQEQGGVGFGLIGQTSFGPRTVGGGTSRNDGSNKGRYAIDGYFLVLRGEDGSTSRRFIYRAVDKAGKPSIAIDGRGYERQ